MAQGLRVIQLESWHLSADMASRIRGIQGVVFNKENLSVELVRSDGVFHALKIEATSASFFKLYNEWKLEKEAAKGSGADAYGSAILRDMMWGFLTLHSSRFAAFIAEEYIKEAKPIVLGKPRSKFLFNSLGSLLICAQDGLGKEEYQAAIEAISALRTKNIRNCDIIPGEVTAWSANAGIRKAKELAMLQDEIARNIVNKRQAGFVEKPTLLALPILFARPSSAQKTVHARLPGRRTIV